MTRRNCTALRRSISKGRQSKRADRRLFASIADRNPTRLASCDMERAVNLTSMVLPVLDTFSRLRHRRCRRRRRRRRIGYVDITKTQRVASQIMPSHRVPAISSNRPGSSPVLSNPRPRRRAEDATAASVQPTSRRIELRLRVSERSEWRDWAFVALLDGERETWLRQAKQGVAQLTR